MNSSDWITAKEASRLLRCGDHAVLRLGPLGRIRHRSLRGDRLLFYRDDVQKLAGK
jgi:excisionase family DNA binding protein